MNEISSSQVVTSSFCPVQSSRVTRLELHPERARVGAPSPGSRPAPATWRRRPAIAGILSRSLRSSMIWMAPVDVLVAAGRARAGSRSARSSSSVLSSPRSVRDGDHAHVDGVVGAARGRRGDGEASPTLTPSFSAWLSKIRIVPGWARSSSLPLVRCSTFGELGLAGDVDAGDAELHRPGVGDHLGPAAPAVDRERHLGDAPSATTASTFL